MIISALAFSWMNLTVKYLDAIGAAQIVFLGRLVLCFLLLGFY